MAGCTWTLGDASKTAVDAVLGSAAAAAAAAERQSAAESSTQCESERNMGRLKLTLSLTQVRKSRLPPRPASAPLPESGVARRGDFGEPEGLAAGSRFLRRASGELTGEISMSSMMSRSLATPNDFMRAGLETSWIDTCSSSMCSTPAELGADLLPPPPPPPPPPQRCGSSLIVCMRSLDTRLQSTPATPSTLTAITFAIPPQGESCAPGGCDPDEEQEEEEEEEEEEEGEERHHRLIRWSALRKKPSAESIVRIECGGGGAGGGAVTTHGSDSFGAPCILAQSCSLWRRSRQQ